MKYKTKRRIRLALILLCYCAAVFAIFQMYDAETEQNTRQLQTVLTACRDDREIPRMRQFTLEDGTHTFYYYCSNSETESYREVFRDLVEHRTPVTLTVTDEVQFSLRFGMKIVSLKSDQERISLDAHNRNELQLKIELLIFSTVLMLLAVAGDLFDVPDRIKRWRRRRAKKRKKAFRRQQQGNQVKE